MVIRIWKTTQDFINLESDLDSLTRKSMGPSLKKMKFGLNCEMNGKFFEDYLKNLVKQPRFVLKLGPVHAFLLISGFNKVLGEAIYYQTIMKKRVGGYYTTNCCMRFLRKLCNSWRKRWFAITGEGICYAKNYTLTEKGFIDNLFFDKTIKIRIGKKITDEQFGKLI